jgi:hypothetical protein
VPLVPFVPLVPAAPCAPFDARSFQCAVSSGGAGFGSPEGPKVAVVLMPVTTDSVKVRSLETQTSLTRMAM